MADQSPHSHRHNPLFLNRLPIQEKENPQYKLKRMRNNDAVRRSRQKAKEQQEAREKELKDLRDKITEKERIIQAKEAELQSFKRQCKCGAAKA